MSIWKQPISLELMHQSRANTMVDHLAIEFTEIGDDYLIAKMPVDHRTCQPMGILHGGASCTLAETVASIAANWSVEESKVCVGLEINTSHVKMVRSGFIYATARPIHLGKTTQLWEIPIIDENGKTISLSRLRLAVIDKVSG